MTAKSAYFQGTSNPKKDKGEKDKATTKERKDRDVRPQVWFKNYDYTIDSPNETSPGGGLYHGLMDRFKSVKDFVEKRRKEFKKRQKKSSDRMSFLVKLAQNKTDVLFVVYPTSIVMTSSKPEFVRAYLNAVERIVNSFPGLVIVSELDRSKGRIGEETEAELQRFVSAISSKAEVIVDSSKSSLDVGKDAFEGQVQDLYLSDQLGDVYVTGCFEPAYYPGKGFSPAQNVPACVGDTVRQIYKQLGIVPKVIPVTMRPTAEVSPQVQEETPEWSPELGQDISEQQRKTQYKYVFDEDLWESREADRERGL